MNKKAFTMAEVMVVLAVIGVLVAILTPTIVKLGPNQSKIMFKKAYYITERVVNELINDETFYSDSDSNRPGFVNDDAVTVNGSSISGVTKFCQLFSTKVNTSGTISCTSGKTSPVATGNANLSSGNFTTNDGITWHIPTTAATGYTTTFTNGGATPTPTAGITRDIIVDINGTDAYDANSNPNCQYNPSSPTTCPNPDQFTITLQYDGKISVTGTKELLYLKDQNIR